MLKKLKFSEIESHHIPLNPTKIYWSPFKNESYYNLLQSITHIFRLEGACTCKIQAVDDQSLRRESEAPKQFAEGVEP